MDNISQQRKKIYTMIKGKIYTADENDRFVESLVLRGNKILFIGRIIECELFLETNGIYKEEINLIELAENQLALPGFIDSHIHPLLAGLAQEAVNISGCKSPQEIIETIKRYMLRNPDKNFIIGLGYVDSMFTEEMPIHYSILDNLSSNIPIVIYRYDAHAYWCNKALLKLAEITPNTPQPEGGKIQLDDNGELVGVLHDGAMALVKRVFPKIDNAKKLKILNSTLDYLISCGVTTFMDAAVKPKNFEVYKNLYSNVEASLNLPRCALSIAVKRSFIDSEKDDTEEEEVEDTIENNLIRIDNFFSRNRIKDWLESNNKFKVNTIKLFIDGVFESGTAMCRKCNCGEEEEEIKPYTFTVEQLQKLIDYFYSNDIQIHSHCIGDLASKMIIDAIESAKINHPDADNYQRNYIAHLQVVALQEIKRMRKLNIYANFSPYWFMEDSFSPILEKMIGKERIKDIYPIKTMIDIGIKCGFGSDWPVSTPVPLEGIEVAVTHRGLGVTPDKLSYNPSQIISIYEAVKAYTIGSAEILGLDKIAGSLEVGKLGDIVILDKNIFEISPWEIHSTSVEMTLIDGNIIYNRSNSK